MPIAIVQSASGTTSGSANTVTATLTGCTSGNSILVRIFGYTASRTISSVNDGSAYTQAVETGNSFAYWCEHWYLVNISSGTHTITATVGSSLTADMRIFVQEVSGIDNASPVAATGIDENTGTSVTSHPCASSALSYSTGDLYLGAGGLGSGGGTITPASGFTSDYVPTVGAGARGLAQSQVMASSGSDQASWTSGTARTHLCCGVVYRAAAVAGGQPFRKRWGGVAHNAYTRRGNW